VLVMIAENLVRDNVQYGISAMKIMISQSGVWNTFVGVPVLICPQYHLSFIRFSCCPDDGYEAILCVSPIAVKSSIPSSILSRYFTSHYPFVPKAHQPLHRIYSLCIGPVPLNAY
jgi:hypothetical protein